MRGKWLIIINVLVLIIVILVLVGMLWNFSFGDVVIEPEECVDVNKDASFSYDSCYDAYSETIFLEIRRGRDDYKINFLKVSFFDFKDNFYELTDVPVIGGSKAYKISAGKNPQNLNIVWDIVKDFSAPICVEAKRVFVRYCSVRASEDGLDISISPLEGVDVDDYIDVVKDFLFDSDVLDLSLVDKERIWESRCKSSWKCGDWESCVDGVQKRRCEDVNECFVSTSIPVGARFCGGTCVENWECEWSGCSGGYTVPKCRDLNSCGTFYDIPQKLKCDFKEKCVPNIECGEWTSCEVDYNFMDLMGSGISNLDGIKSRICEDKNFCVDLRKELKSCSVKVDIYTKKFIRCGVEFVGIYNRLNNNLIARIKEGTDDEPYMDIYFDDRDDDVYCDYCYDGILNSDEEGIDCGGSCMPCDEKYRTKAFERVSWFSSFINWVKGLF